MGFFDFLHGSVPRKSEAEEYMEKRNKEYARKAAEYKRRESMATAKEGLFEFGKLFTPKQQAKNYTKPVNNYLTQRTEQATIPTNFPQKTYSRKPRNNCDECGTSNSIYDSDHLDIFTVENAFAKSSTRTVTASGAIVRGGFSVGDKVEVKTTLETRVVTIQQMFRQGESIQYANVSSGKIAMVLSNAADILVRKGDMIKKKK